jgi:hypothetical protein
MNLLPIAICYLFWLLRTLSRIKNIILLKFYEFFDLFVVVDEHRHIKVPKHVALLCDTLEGDELSTFLVYFQTRIPASSISIYHDPSIAISMSSASYPDISFHPHYQAQRQFLHSFNNDNAVAREQLDLVIVKRDVMNLGGIDPLRIKLAEFYRLDSLDPGSLFLISRKYSLTQQRFGK